MPKNIPEDASSFPTQTSPLDTEPRDGLSVETPFTNASRRTAYLRDRVEFVDPTREGVRRIRRFPTSAALKSSLDHVDKTVAVIDGVGAYQFDASSMAQELSPMVFRPNDIGAASAGRWLLLLLGSCAVPNGIATLDPNGNVHPEQIRSGVVDAKYANVGANQSIAQNDTFADIVGLSVTLDPLEPGDIIEVDANTRFDGTNGDVAQIRVSFSAPGVATVDSLPTMTKLAGALTFLGGSQKLYWTAGTSQPYTVKVQVAGKSANAAVAYASGSWLIVKGVRP